MAITFTLARDLVDGDLIELSELPFRYTSEARGYTVAAGDQLVRIGSNRGPHTNLGGGRITLHTDHGDWDVNADLDFVVARPADG